MDVQDPRLRTLLRQANKVADAGKRAAAEQLYRQLLEEGPNVAEAWFGLGQVLYDPTEKKDAYQKALTLKPDYVVAARALAELQDVPIPDWAIAPEPEPEEETVPEVVEPEPEPEMATAVSPTTTQEYDLVCYRHPNRATSLRCYTCDKPICSSCAIKTPVGYSCPNCIREKEDLFFNATPLDYVIAPAVGLVLSLVAGYLVVRFTVGGSFFLLFVMLFIGGLVGRFIGQFSKQAIGRRRGRYLPQVMVAVLIVGTAVWLLPILLLAGLSSIGAFFGPGIYLFGAVGTLFSYMK